MPVGHEDAAPRLNTVRRVALALAVLVLGAVTAGAPVDAAEKRDVTIRVGEPAVIQDTGAPIPGYVASRRAESAPTPENCANGGLADSYCHRYKVILDVPPSELARGGFLFTAILEWDRGTEIPNAPQLGSAGTNQLVMRIYEEPKYVDEDGTETYTAASGLANPSPTALAVVDPMKPFYWVIVANYLGAGNDYKLTLRIDDLVGGGPPADLSAEEDLPPVFDASAFGAADEPSDAGTVALVGPEPSVGVTGTPAAPALPSLPGLGAPDFALDGIGGGGLDSDDLEEIQLASGPRPLPPPGDPNGALLVLWLVGLPVLGLGLPFLFVWRRRREEVPATS